MTSNLFLSKKQDELRDVQKLEKEKAECEQTKRKNGRMDGNDTIREKYRL